MCVVVMVAIPGTTMEIGDPANLGRVTTTHAHSVAKHCRPNEFCLG